MHRFITKPSSPSPEATDSQDKIEVSSGGDKVTYKRSETEKKVQKKETREKRQATSTTEGDSPTDDGYSWRKCGQTALRGSKFPRSYYRCIHKNLGCQALKHVQQLSSDPPRYTTIYRGKHNCKNPPKTPQITHQSSLIHKFDPFILFDSKESSINNATLKTMMPYG